MAAMLVYEVGAGSVLLNDVSHGYFVAVDVKNMPHFSFLCRMKYYYITTTLFKDLFSKNIWLVNVAGYRN
jgi:hypothetical protein